MRLAFFQIIIALAVAMPQVTHSCEGSQTCCGEKISHHSVDGAQVSQRACCCDSGTCSMGSEHTAMAQVIPHGERLTFQAPAQIRPLSAETVNEDQFIARSRGFRERSPGIVTSFLFFHCVFRC